MIRKKGFSSERYIEAQSAAVLKRINEFDKLYLEFGGKLTYDGHASRVLPGFKPTTKIDLLKNLGELEIIYCINANDLESDRRLGDFELTYREQTLKDIKEIRKNGLEVNHLCITFFEGRSEVKKFKKEIENLGIKVYTHKRIEGYPDKVNKIIDGFSKQRFIKTKTKLVIVTGASGGSGKMATAMAQVYNERKNGVNAGFSKYELFPIWNLALNHPINIAYEAATADLGDYNMIDSYHWKAYKIKAVNYNRDVENFKILRKIYSLVAGKKILSRFKSPTDMGINMAKKGIIDDKICRSAAIKEIKRRDKIYKKEFKAGRESIETVKRMKKILNKIKK
ncbi:DUF1846 family protein [archaeon]|nr:DUF1846 family protein [archaeon]